MPDCFEFRFEIPQTLDGLRIDTILAKLYPEYSRNQWIVWLKKGLIYHEQLALNPKNKLKAHLIVHGKVPIDVAHSHDIAQDIPIDIVYEDEHFMVINKASGLVVHPGAGQKDQTLLNALLFHHPELKILPRAGIVHRLDKDTTGLMVIAKTPLCYQRLVQAMANREIKRVYLALVHGQMTGGASIRTQFGRHPKNRLKMAVLTHGKEAVTHYQIEERFSQNTLLRVQLETGRTHQIRVHLSYQGFPIVGDPLYGKARAPGKGPMTDALNKFPRQALHAMELNLIHPITEKPLTFTANIPDDFALLIHILQSN
jgi:23S rRNA pseudouridine1911/1915/1917 synthase